MVIRRHSNAAELGGLPNDLTVNYSTTASSSAPYSDAGTYPINAALAGQAAGDYAVTVVPGVLTITQAKQTITFPYLTSYESAIALTTVPLIVSVSTPVPLTVVTQSSSVCTVAESSTGSWSVSFLTSGNCSLMAYQVATTDYAPVWSQQTFWVGRTTQTVTFPYVAQTYEHVGIPAQLNATSTSGLPVSFGSQTPSVCTVSESATGVWTATLLTRGNCSLGASQLGNNVYYAAPWVGQTFWVYGAAQTINFPYIAETSYKYANTTVTLSATDSSGSPVTFGSYTPSVCTASESANGVWTANLLTYGNCSLYAIAAENLYYEATTTSQTFWVYKAAQTITFPAIANQPAGTSFLLPATASSSLLVSYTSTTPSVCTIDTTGAYAVLAAAGTCTIQANQAGNATFVAAPTVTRSFTVTVP